jgi:hypothetical protein
MPSVVHEALIELVRAKPHLLAHLAGLPGAGWEVASADLGVVVPVERRADALLFNRQARQGLLLEVFRRLPRGKLVILAGYQVIAVQQLGLPVAVVILATSRAVARAARKPYFLGGGSVFQALAFGPDELPILDDPDDPHLAVFIALIHSRARDAERAARIALAKLPAVDAPTARDYTTLILACVTGKVREALEKTMLSLNLPPSRVVRILEERQKAEAREEGREEGRQQALQGALRTLLRHRFHGLSAWADSRIDDASEDILVRWLIRCVDAGSVEEVLVAGG